MRGSVRKRGKRWYYYFYSNVGGTRKKIERVGGDTKREALKALNKALVKLDQGEKAVDSSMLLKDFADFWIEEYAEKNCRESTVMNYKQKVKQINKRLGNYKLSALKPAVIQKFANNLLDSYKRSTAKSILTILKGILNYAVHPLQLINSNPAAFIKLPREVLQSAKKNKKVKTITTDEFSNLLSLYSELSLYHAFLMVGFYTGCRKGEILGLEWGNVNLEDKTIKIVQSAYYNQNGKTVIGAPKSKSSIRTIVLPKTLVAYLKKLKTFQNEQKLKYGKSYNNSGFVIVNNNGAQPDYWKINKISLKAKNNCNIDFNPHMLRHTHATMLLENGATMKDIQQRLGHKKIETTMNIYAHSTESAERKTAEILDKITINL